MHTPEQAATRRRKQKLWVIVLVCSLFVWALFWSVDVSIFYILTGFSVFCLFKVLQYRRVSKPVTPPYESQQRADHGNKTWDQFKESFNSSASNSGKKDKQKQLGIIVVVILVFILLTVVIPAFLIDDNNYNNDVSALRSWAEELSDREQYDSAASLLKQASELDPKNADIYLERGNAFLNGNKNDSALLEYDKVLALNPQYKEAYYNRAVVYYYRKQYRPAIVEAKMALRASPDYTDAMVLTGDCFYNSSQADSALVWYEQAYAGGYRSAALSHIMAYINDTKGQTQKAIALYKEALVYDTTRVEIYSRLGELVQGEEGNAYRAKATGQIKQ